MTNKCPNCPVPDGTPCLATVDPLRFAMFCEWAESGTDGQRQHIIGRSRIGLGGSPVPPPTQAAAPSVAESLAMIARVKECPNWVPRSDCGCSINECRLGKGQAGKVTHNDCFACLREAGAIACESSSGTR